MSLQRTRYAILFIQGIIAGLVLIILMDTLKPRNDDDGLRVHRQDNIMESGNHATEFERIVKPIDAAMQRQTQDVFTTLKDLIAMSPHQETTTISKPVPRGFRPTEKCVARRQHVFYVGIHRTGSSTLRIMLQEYARKRELNLCMDSITKWRSAWPFVFTSDLVMVPYGKKCDVLAEPMIYHQDELRRIAYDDTVFVTSLRHPLDHFLSMFSSNQILRFARDLSGKGNSMAPLEAMNYYLDNPDLFMRFFASLPDKKKGNQFQTLLQRRNIQLYDLGFTDGSVVTTTEMHEVVAQFHMIVMTEYFDESLVLLKNQLCWKNEDLMYNTVKLSRKPHIRQRDFKLSSALNQRILNYNSGDVQLYKIANDTFWSEVAKIPNFKEQLQDFKQHLTEFQSKCESAANDKQRLSLGCFPKNENTFWNDLQNKIRWRLQKLSLDKLHINTP